MDWWEENKIIERYGENVFWMEVGEFVVCYEEVILFIVLDYE